MLLNLLHFFELIFSWATSNRAVLKNYHNSDSLTKSLFASDKLKMVKRSLLLLTNAVTYGSSLTIPIIYLEKSNTKASIFECETTWFATSA